jgi:hypothetical protein
MEVGVGSFSDPEGLEGLAHFLGQFVHLPSLPIPSLPLVTVASIPVRLRGACA